ncbi:hypothetical protein [Lysinibacillus sp. FSL W8-0992]|uniref:hypothetical protein n=1 Tax=Lysinibacillus sp. FSL W8-0992 TaxID=2954643 RepID=UPI0030FC2474
MGYYEYKIKWCKVCDQGWIEIVKDEDNNKLLLQCSECMSQWDGINELSEGIFKEDEVNVIVPDFEEIKKLGWDIFIINK